MFVAKEKGFFADEGLNVTLEPQANWKVLLDGVIGGHCGLPFTKVVGDRLWHNPGAIGMPANDGTPRRPDVVTGVVVALLAASAVAVVLLLILVVPIVAFQHFEAREEGR